MEMLDAARYYELQASGLGEDFLDKVESAAQDIRSHPERWPIMRSNIRRRLIHRFPFGLLYRIDLDEVVVVAVMHVRRHPDYWLNRV